jgi:hypothetical protein
MQAAHLDIFTTCLDTISFFLVTTDLYGEERLEKLGVRLGERPKFDRVFGAIWLALVVVGFWIFYRYYEAHIPWFKQHFYLMEALIKDFTGFALILVGIISLPVTALIMPILSKFSEGAAYLLRKANMKGIFLTVGTILFVAARFVSVLGSMAGK